MSGPYWLVSPNLRIPSKPTKSGEQKTRKRVIDWKKIVAFTWDHLDKNYKIDEPHLFTRIFTWSRGNKYTPGTEKLYISKLKRLCIAIIHFEDVFHGVMEHTDPPAESHVDDYHFRRNWRENPNLGQLPLSQAQSIYQIAAIEDKVENMNRLLQSIEPGVDDDFIRYRWCLQGLFLDDADVDFDADRAVMFSIPRTCSSTANALRWIETVTLFVRAAFSCPAALLGSRKYPPNVHGFASFLQGNHRPDGANCGGDPDGDTSSSEGSE